MGSITFLTHEGARYPVDAEPGTNLMQLAISNDVPGILAECGGGLSCATCHVHVHRGWLGRLEPPTQLERDLLEFAVGPDETSRLSCQLVFRAELDGMLVRIPPEQ